MPLHLKNNVTTKRAISEIENDGANHRLLGFAASIFKSYAPRLHKYYGDTLQKLCQEDPRLSCGPGVNLCVGHGGDAPHPPGAPHQPDPWASRTNNLGRRVATVEHVDQANLAWGMCAIIALGGFDPDKGGHLVLHDLGLVIRFPPGATILIPSAILRHSNIAVPNGQARYSMTLYTAGGLFRWVYNGCKTDKTISKDITPELLEKRRADRQQRWAQGLQMFSKLSELL
jgi:hypothetical protein